MATFVSTIEFITDGEQVNATTIGRVTQQLDQRTLFLKSRQDELFERKERLQIDSFACASDVVDYRVVYFDDVSGLFRLAEVKSGDFSNPNNTPLGIAINARSLGTGFVCDVVLKGRITLPASEEATLIADGDGFKSGEIYYLNDSDVIVGDDGRVTRNAPGLDVPIFYSLAPNTSGDFEIIVDVQSFIQQSHEHVREVLTWNPLGIYTLSKSPITPDAVFMTIDEVPQRYDDGGTGSFTSFPDPDYVVSNQTLTLYDPTRFEINPQDPKVVVWYVTPFGDTEGVTALIAGKNIELGSCDISNGVAKGRVTITSKQSLNEIIDVADSAEIVKSIVCNDVTKELDITTGLTVEQIEAGTNISITATEAPGRGKVRINASPGVNTFDLLQSESIFLQNAKEELVGELTVPTVVLEGDGNEFYLAKWALPNAMVSGQTLEIRFVVVPIDAVPTADVGLTLEYKQIGDAGLVTSSFVSTTTTINLSSLNINRRQTHDVSLSGLSALQNRTLILKVSRDETDAYTGRFHIIHTLLKYKAAVV